MAYVQNVDGALLVLQLGNGGSPEVFAASCTINTNRSLEFSAGTSTAELADCVTPTNPAQMARIVKSLDVKFTGAGTADATSLLALIQWMRTGAAKNCKIVQNLTGAQGGWTVTGPFVCTQIQEGGSRGESQTFSITIEQAGATTVTANA